MCHAGQGHLSPTAHLNVTDPTVADSATLLQLMRYLVGARHVAPWSMYISTAATVPQQQDVTLGLHSGLQLRLGLLLCSVPGVSYPAFYGSPLHTRGVENRS